MATDTLLQEWLIAERDAVVAESKVTQLGQGAADPRVGTMLQEANELRQKADLLFRRMYPQP